MKIIGIISEYNPLHLGHIYQLTSIKKKYPDSIVVAFMSGSFVQRGEPAIVNKYFRAKSAVDNGLDLVLEIPTVISLQSANFFAKYSVKVLDLCGVFDYLSFGIEEDSEKAFFDKLKAYYEKKDLVDKRQYDYIKKGLSYKKSFDLALKDELDMDLSSFTRPNNTLGLAYVRTLKDLKSLILPLPIIRKGAGYHNLEDGDFQYQSASFIRKNIFLNKKIGKYLPKKININKDLLHRLDDYRDIFYYQAFVMSKSPKDIAGYENGILNLLKKNFYGSIEDMVLKSHNSRYSISRLKRFVLNYLLDINKSHIGALDRISYIKPLYFNERGAMALKLIKEKEFVTIVNKPKDYKYLSSTDKLLYDLDLTGFSLYNIKSCKQNKNEYTNKPFLSQKTKKDL